VLERRRPVPKPPESRASTLARIANTVKSPVLATNQITILPVLSFGRVSRKHLPSKAKAGLSRPSRKGHVGPHDKKEQRQAFITPNIASQPGASLRHQRLLPQKPIDTPASLVLTHFEVPPSAMKNVPVVEKGR
jgi:hypothetical protein